jgi:hypothetical protein
VTLAQLAAGAAGIPAIPQLVTLLVGAALGGLVAFAWGQVAFGNRLTRVEVRLDALDKTVEKLLGLFGGSK